MKKVARVTLVGSAGLGVFCDKKPKASGSASQAKVKTPRSGTKQKHKARVVLVRDKDVISADGSLNGEILAKMVDEGLVRLLEEDDATSAWGRLFGPQDTVGIKSNVWRFLPTPKEIEEHLVHSVQTTGVNEERIAVDDRGVLENPVFSRATALLNVRCSRTHHWSGVGSLIKNYIMFHPEPWTWHDDSCAKLAGLWNLPAVKGKTRLNILVMLTPLFHGKGPHHFQAKYTWDYKGLVLSRDPVAADSIGLSILQAKRGEHFGKSQPLATEPKHIQVAQDKFSLGTADLDRIELIKIGWKEGILI